MRRSEFDTFIGNLGAYFERPSSPATKAADLWFAQVSYIPSEALTWIYSHVISSSAAWPRNVALAVLDAYSEWRGEHPSRQASQEQVACPECDNGIIYSWRRVNSRLLYRYVSACPHCRSAPAGIRNNTGEGGCHLPAQ